MNVQIPRSKGACIVFEFLGRLAFNLCLLGFGRV